MRLVVLAVLLGVLGCNAECIEGICPAPEHATPHAGPCESATEDDAGDTQRCSYSYDDAGQLTRIRCTAPVEQGAQEARWTWDDAGPVTIDVFGEGGEQYWRWSFSADRVEQEITSATTGILTPYRTYDRALFQFMPMVGIHVTAPRAGLGLISDRSDTYTWTREGNTYTRTRDGASSSTPHTVTVDDRERITRIGGYEHETLTYEGDLLMSREWDLFEYEAYTYDRGGNIAQTEHWSDGYLQRTVYDYACW